MSSEMSHAPHHLARMLTVLSGSMVAPSASTRPLSAPVVVEEAADLVVVAEVCDVSIS
jgi:hypothetical protein